MATEHGVRSFVFLGLIALIIFGTYVVFSGYQLFGDVILNNGALIAVAFFGIYLFSKSDFLLKLSEYERAVLYRLGRFAGVKGPGWILLIPGIDEYTLVDMRTKVLDIPKEDVITKEKVELKIDTVLYVTVKDPEKAILNVDDYENAIKQYIIGALRDVVGTMTVDDVISNVDDINKALDLRAKEMSEKWGVEVNVELKDVDLPKKLLEAMHEAQAAVKRADAIRTLANADRDRIEAITSVTDKMSERSLVYYYMEALKALASGRASKLIVPMELTQLANVFGGGARGAPPKGELSPDVEQLISKYAGLLKATDIPEKVPAKASDARKKRAGKNAAKDLFED